MKSKIGWIVVTIFVLVALLFLPSLMRGLFWGNGYGGMMGGYGGMMSGWGFMNPLGFLGMALMWLLPLGTVILLAYGAAVLFGLSKPGDALPAERNCANCGKGAHADWTSCPYCGKTL